MKCFESLYISLRAKGRSRLVMQAKKLDLLSSLKMRRTRLYHFSKMPFTDITRNLSLCHHPLPADDINRLDKQTRIILLKTQVSDVLHEYY